MLRSGRLHGLVRRRTRFVRRRNTPIPRCNTEEERVHACHRGGTSPAAILENARLTLCVPTFPSLVCTPLLAVSSRRQGENAVKMGRQMLGATNPQESMPGTIRGDFSIVVGRNICHGSDSVENAEKEIKLWFEEGEVLDWESHSLPWIYE